MATVQLTMLAGLPYTALRDAVIAHPTMPEGPRFALPGGPSKAGNDDPFFRRLPHVPAT